MVVIEEETKVGICREDIEGGVAGHGRLLGCVHSRRVTGRRVLEHWSIGVLRCCGVGILEHCSVSVTEVSPRGHARGWRPCMASMPNSVQRKDLAGSYE